jgi:pyrimidine oxygenase
MQMQLGVFIPIGNNGWLISTTSPQYLPSFDLNRTIVEKAERFGFDFALSMIKLHGFGGPSQFWDHNLESFTLWPALLPSPRAFSSSPPAPFSLCRRRSPPAWR